MTEDAPAYDATPVPQTHTTIEDRRRSDYFRVDHVVITSYVPVIGPSAFTVYAALCRFADYRKGTCLVSVPTISKAIGMSTATVSRGLATLTGKDGKLKDAGLPPLVRITHRYKRENGAQVSSLYTILDVSDTIPPITDDGTPLSPVIATPISPVIDQEQETVREQQAIANAIAADAPSDTKVAPPKAERKPTPIYEVVEAWATAIGLDELPGAKTKPWGMAKTAVRDGLLPEEVAPIHAWLSADEWWRKRGIDIATIAGQKGKWQSVGSPGAVRDGAGTWAAHLRHLIDTEPWHYAGSANRERVEAARREWEKRNTP